MRSGLLAGTGLAVLALASAGARQPPQDSRPRPIVSPATGVTAQPQLTVSGRGVLLSWIERTGRRAALKYAERTADGWTAPREVASGEDWFVNWADVPSVIRMADRTLAAHWLQKSGPDTYAYDVRLSYSTNDGRTWSPSFLPHHDGTKTEHGFAALFRMPDAGLGLVWLDGRETAGASHDAGAPGAAGHAAPARGAMTLRYAAFDRAWKQTADAAIDVRVCDCCPNAAAVGAEGPIVAYRNRSDDEVRDIYVSRLDDRGRWSEPRPVHEDGWRINACPVNGPRLDARGRDVAIAWFTGLEPPRAFVAFSTDAGRTFGAPIRIDDQGTLGRVDVALLPDGSAAASWIEQANGQTEVRYRRVDRSGRKGPAVAIAPVAASRESGYPRLAFHNGELIFAWTDVTRPQPGAAASSRVMTAAARVGF